MNIPTTEGQKRPDSFDLDVMDWLDGLACEIPYGGGFGLLLYRGDPTAFRLVKAEWLRQVREAVNA